MEEGKTSSILHFPEGKQNSELNSEPQRDVTVHERRIWDWLAQHAQLWARIVCIALVIGGLAGVFRWMNERKIQKRLRVYQNKATLAERVAWAEDASLPSDLKDMRGLVFLEQANEHMKAKEYEKALLFYQKAKNFLKVSPLSDEAAAGCGFAALHVNDLDAAEKVFHPLCKSSSKHIHAQALYGLCYIAGKKNKEQDFSHYKTQLAGYDLSNELSTQLGVLFPEMGK